MAFRICSFSGGGVRGIIPATIISEMLKITKTLGGKGDIRDLCDYVVGTSIGGIIAAGLVASEDGQNPKFTPEEAIELLKENAAKVFPPDANFLQQLVITLFAEA